MDFELDVALSWMQDFCEHYNNQSINSTAEDNIAICLDLLDSDDAARFLNAAFVDELRKRVQLRKTELIKNAEERIETMRRGFR